MQGDKIRPRLRQLANVVLRAGDHQMAVQRLAGQLFHLADEKRRQGQVRYKMTVHNVDVKIVCVLVDKLDLFFEFRQIHTH